MGETSKETPTATTNTDAILSSTTEDLQESLLEVHELPPCEDPNATAAAAQSLETDGWKMIHWVNIVAYLCNVVLVQLFAFGGVANLPDNTELSKKYMTLVTPAGWSFTIWPVIFFHQLLFIVAQCTPRFRNSPLVHSGGGVGYWYAFTCLFQVMWSIAFAYEKLWMSFIFILHVLVCLLAIVRNQYRTLRARTPASTSADHGNDVLSQRLEYWLLKFPFDLHAGWIIVATVVNVNVAVVGSDFSMKSQVIVAVMSLVHLLPVPYVALYKFRKPPNYAMAGVFVWGTAGIISNLNNPNTSLPKTYSQQTVSTLRGVTIFACLLGVVMFIPVLRRVRGAANGGGEDGDVHHDDDDGGGHHDGVEGASSSGGGGVGEEEEEARRGLMEEA